MGHPEAIPGGVDLALFPFHIWVLVVDWVGLLVIWFCLLQSQIVQVWLYDLKWTGTQGQRFLLKLRRLFMKGWYPFSG